MVMSSPVPPSSQEIDTFTTIALDVWAARIQFRTSFISSKYGKCVIRSPNNTFVEYSPTKKWTHGGPLLEGISIEHFVGQNGEHKYMAYMGSTKMGNTTISVDGTQLIAGIRTFVKANMHKYAESMRRTDAILQEDTKTDQKVAEAAAN